jgi:ribonuclease BN (tRNA processing enzyme)
MAHPIPTLGLRYETDGRAFAYSADTGPSPALVDLAKDADLLFAEATWLDDGIERPPDLHMCAREAGEHAARAAVGRLVLTHIHPEVDRAAARAEASGPFDGPVADAVRSARWVVGE